MCQQSVSGSRHAVFIMCCVSVSDETERRNFMQYVLTGEEMKAGDRNAIENMKMPSVVLMERASLSFVERLVKEGVNLKKVLVVCGSGNNGGDGYAAARMLLQRGSAVTLLSLGKVSSMSPETRLQREIYQNFGGREVSAFPDETFTLVIDAVFGVGLSRDIKGQYADAIEKMNALSAFKAAVDIPSGISSATGEIMGTAFRADLTSTFAALKRGHVLFPGEDFCGKVFVEDIGIPTEIFDERTETSYTVKESELFSLLPARKRDGHKGHYGKVLVIGGCKGMAGAVGFSAAAALRSGSGLVKILSHEENREILQCMVPEAMFLPFDAIDEGLAFADVIVLGCGLGTHKEAAGIVRYVLTHSDKPLVLDADGINNVLTGAEDAFCAYKGEMVLTPHVGELSRLLHKEVADLLAMKERIPLIEAFCAAHPGKVLCAKDARTFVKQAGQKMYINTVSSPALSKGGSGDVLSGVIASLIGQGLSAYDGARTGTLLHGIAGREAEKLYGIRSPLASDVIRCLTLALKNKE